MFRRFAAAGLVCATLAGCALPGGGGDVPAYKDAVFADRWYARDAVSGQIADIDYFLHVEPDARGFAVIHEALRRTERDSGRVRWLSGDTCPAARQLFRRLLNYQYAMTQAREAGGDAAHELQEEYRVHLDKTLAPCWRYAAPF